MALRSSSLASGRETFASIVDERWEADERPEPRSLGLLPSGSDPVGEWLVHRQPPVSISGLGNAKASEPSTMPPALMRYKRNGETKAVPDIREGQNLKPQYMLDKQLEADSIAVGALKLCEVRLINDVRFPWLVLVPQRADLVEIIDLDPSDQALLTEDIARASSILKTVTGCYKLNVAALGNQVRQLHVHIIARFENDAAWPAPIWGRGASQLYDANALEALIAKLRKAFGFA